MISLELYTDDRDNFVGWYSNLLNYALSHVTDTVTGSSVLVSTITEFGGTLDLNHITFDNEQDATAFLLRWS